ncbi:MAG TPA: helix-turn-helix domain-containing protein [Candidatus Nitrosocosmicus sp.]
MIFLTRLKKQVYPSVNALKVKEGIEGLKTRRKSGRPSKISEEVMYQIKKELKESNRGWTTIQIKELIIKKSGIKYHYIHIYRILRK